MLKNCFLIFLFLWGFGYSQQVQWYKTEHHSCHTSIGSASRDANGNIYIAGPTDNGTAQDAVFISKYSPSGNLIWSDSLGAAWGITNAVTAVDLFNNVYLAFGIRGNQSITIGGNVYPGDYRMYLVKYNTLGQVQWVTNQSVFATDPFAITIDKKSHVFLCGISSNNNGFITKYDSLGTCLNVTGTPQCHDIAVDKWGNIFLADKGVYKYDSAFNLQWSYKSFLGDGWLDVDTLGNCYLTSQGSYFSNYITKLSSNGQHIWTINPVGGSAGNAITVGEDGFIYASGKYGTPTTYDGMGVGKFDSNGNQIWSYQRPLLPTDGFYFVPRTIIIDSSGVYVGGCESDECAKAFILKLSNSFATTHDEINRSTLIAIFPNPSSGIFTLKGETNETKISVHDVLGNCVLNKEYRNEAELKIDLSDQPKGIYFVEISSESGRVVRKIVIE